MGVHSCPGARRPAGARACVPAAANEEDCDIMPKPPALPTPAAARAAAGHRRE